MARDQILVDLYDAHLGRPLPDLMADEAEGLMEVDRGIAGIASVYLNNTRPLTGDHRAWLAGYLADLEEVERRFVDEDAREYVRHQRDLGRYLLESRI